MKEQSTSDPDFLHPDIAVSGHTGRPRFLQEISVMEEFTDKHGDIRGDRDLSQGLGRTRNATARGIRSTAAIAARQQKRSIKRCLARRRKRHRQSTETPQTAAQAKVQEAPHDQHDDLQEAQSVNEGTSALELAYMTSFRVATLMLEAR